jgi:hypothetical protein
VPPHTSHWPTSHGDSGLVQIWRRSSRPCPCLDLFITRPAPPIRLGIFKKVFQIGSQPRLVVFGDDDVIAVEVASPPAEFPLRLQSIHGEDAPRDQGRDEQRFERAHLILLCSHLAVQEDQARLHFVEAEQMHRFLGARRGTDRFAIDRDRRFVLASCLEEQAARFVSTTTLTIRAREKGGQDPSRRLGIQHG